MGFSYKDAGVDIDRGEEVVEKIDDLVKSTYGPEVLSGLGGFGALFAPDLSQYSEPVFVSGTDGVGTKLKLAFMSGKHDTVGIDLVAMCVNDILAQGAKPLFFLDYLASGRLNPDQMSQVVSGIAAGCREAGCALIGGETAEMPDFYDSGEYDMAGFTVGMVDREKIITGEEIKSGDLIIGLGSDGLHSNGFSLVRKILFEHAGYDLNYRPEGWKDSLGKKLLKPTRIYVKPVLKLIDKFAIKGIAHITGGGLIENIARILPEKLRAILNTDSWFRSKIFDLLQTEGEIEKKEIYRTFNMGIGLVLIVRKEKAEIILNKAVELGEKAYLIGKIEKMKDRNNKEKDRVSIL